MNNLFNHWIRRRRVKQRALSLGTRVFSSLSRIILKTMLMWASTSCLVFLKGRLIRIYWLVMPRARFRFLIPNSDIVNLARRNLELRMTSSLALLVLEVVSLTNPPQTSTPRRCSSKVATTPTQRILVHTITSPPRIRFNQFQWFKHRCWYSRRIKTLRSSSLSIRIGSERASRGRRARSTRCNSIWRRVSSMSKSLRSAGSSLGRATIWTLCQPILPIEMLHK